jgi:hypothetical protein
MYLYLLNRLEVDILHLKSLNKCIGNLLVRGFTSAEHELLDLPAQTLQVPGIAAAACEIGDAL